MGMGMRSGLAAAFMSIGWVVWMPVAMIGTTTGAAIAQIAPGESLATAVPDTEDPSGSSPDDVSALSVDEPADVPPGVKRPTGADEAFVDGLIVSAMAQYGVAGYVASMVRGDEVMFAKGYGLADAETATPATGDLTRFWIGSISKTFVWTAVMMAVDRGQIDLDADVNIYLKRYQAPAADRPLTMNDLMAHRVGLEDTFKIFLPDMGRLRLAEALAATEPKAVFARGDRTAYSNWATTLAVLVLEDATGRPYEDILFNDLLLPLGMTSTTLTSASPAAARLPVSRSYKATPTGLVDAGQLELGAFSPIGGMTTTAADMARWMSFHLGKGALGDRRLMSESAYEVMRTRAFRDRLSAADLAHGMMDAPYRGLDTYGHGGSINSFLSNMVLVPELGIGIFLSQNNEQSAEPIRMVPGLVIDRELMAVRPGLLFQPIIAAGRAEAPDTAKSETTDDGPGRTERAEDDKTDAEGNATEVAGAYLSNRRPFTGFEKLFGAQSLMTIVADGELIYVEGSKSTPFRRLAPDLYENRLGSRLAFIRNEAARVVALADGSGTATWERAGGLNSPNALNLSIAAVISFAITIWLGLWRRLGRNPGRADTTTPVGRALSALALGATVPVAGVIAALVAFQTGVEGASYADIFADYPPKAATLVILAGSIVAVVGGVLCLSLVPAWRSSGWSLWRKAHFSVFALSCAAAGIVLWWWGLAFSSPLSAG